jgi:hypothetical protein
MPACPSHREANQAGRLSTALNTSNTQPKRKKMSIDFRPLTPIRMADLFDGRLERVGVRQHHPERTLAPNEKCLTDGLKNYLFVYSNEKGRVSSFTSWMPNGDPKYILQAICGEFDVDIVSEHEPQYWGFKTQEEWDAAWAKMAERDEQDFFNEVVKFVRDEGHNIRSGTVGMDVAEIARKLITDNPDLLDESKRTDLMKVVNAIYDREPREKGTLDFLFEEVARTQTEIGKRWKNQR